MPKIYIAYHPDEYHRPRVEAALELLSTEHQDLSHWQFTRIPLTVSGTFNPLDIYSLVNQTIGPTVFFGDLRKAQIATFVQKIAQRAVVVHAASGEEVYDKILDAIARHDRGEPEWPIKLAVALLLVAKLERKGYWGGEAKNKNFLRVDDLANGNGLDEKYKPYVHEIAEYLSSDGRAVRLLSCKRGDGRPKYACNSSDRKSVYSFLRTRRVHDGRMMEYLTRDTKMVPNAELASINPMDYEDHRVNV